MSAQLAGIIYAEFTNFQELNLTDRVLLSKIILLDNAKHCSASNKFFAENFGVSEVTVSTSINKLMKLGYVELVKWDGRHRTIKSYFTKQLRN